MLTVVRYTVSDIPRIVEEGDLCCCCCRDNDTPPPPMIAAGGDWRHENRGGLHESLSHFPLSLRPSYRVKFCDPGWTLFRPIPHVYLHYFPLPSESVSCPA